MKLSLKITALFSLNLLFFGCGGVTNLPTLNPKTAQNEIKITQKNPVALSEKEIESRVLNYGENLAVLKQKLAKNSALSVKFFGDSHIASDDISATFAKTLFKNGVNSVGFALPLLPKYHNNSILGYKQNGFELISSQTKNYDDFALCGVVASAKSGANLELFLKQNLKNPLIFEMLFKSDELGKIAKITDVKNAQFFITNSKKNLWQRARFELSLPLKMSVFKGIKLGWYMIYDKTSPKFSDICGINGAFSSLYLKWSEASFSRDLAGFRYDLIAIAYGTNDAFDDNLNEQKFYENLKKLIQKIRENHPSVTILLISPPTADKKNFKNVQKMIKKLAINEKTLFYDTELFMNLNGKKEGWIELGLSKTDVHLTREGYKKVGFDLANELKKLLLNVK